MQNPVKIVCAWKKEKKVGAFLLALSFLFAFFLGAFSVYFLWQQYDSFYQMYAHGSVAQPFLQWSALGIALIFLLLILCLKGRLPDLQEVKEAQTDQKSMDVLSCFVTIFLSVSLLINAFLQPSFSFLFFGTGLLALPCALSFLGSLFSYERRRFLTLLCRFCVPVLLLLRLFSLYFDTTLPTNAPFKIWEILCVLALCLASMAELRQSLGLPCSRFLWGSVCVALPLTALSAVPQLLRYALQGQSMGLFTLFALWETILLCHFLLPLLAPFFHGEIRQIYLYLFFGILTTGVDFVLYAFLTRTVALWELLANLLAWIGSVAFAFFVNKFFVFSSKDCTAVQLCKEVGGFFGARILSLGAESFLLWLFVSAMGQSDWLGKAVGAVFVIVLNYIASKFLIFQKKQEPPKNENIAQE